MKSDQRRSLSGGGAGSSPAFSHADVVRAGGMGVQLEVELSPSELLGLRHATDTVTIRSERAARVAAEKRVDLLEEALTEALSRLATVRCSWRAARAATEKWRRLALASVPLVAIQTAVILWMWWRA